MQKHNSGTHETKQKGIMSSPHFTRKLAEEPFLKILVILVLLKFVKLEAWKMALPDATWLQVISFNIINVLSLFIKPLKPT